MRDDLLRRLGSIFVVLVAGCGGKVDGEQSEPADVGVDAADVGVDAPAVEPAWSRVCPRERPLSGDPCTSNFLTCEYGDDPNVACNAVFECTGGSWRGSLPSGVTCPTPGSGDAACPAFDLALDTTCDHLGAMCAYGSGLCACSAKPGYGGALRWGCIPLPAGCPSTRPRLGATCALEGRVCDYGECYSRIGYVGPQVKCQDGAWVRDDLCGG